MINAKTMTVTTCILASLLCIFYLYVSSLEPNDDQDESYQPAWFKPLVSDQEVFDELKRRPDLINAYNNDGYTGLHLAVIRGDMEQVVSFVKAGADINLPVLNKSIQSGDTPLILGVFGVNLKNNTDIPSYLLNAHADVNKGNSEGTRPIHQLLWITDHNLRMDIAKKLVSRGADINAQTKQGNTMLHLSVEKYDKKWIDMVKDVFGSSLNFSIKNNDGLTPLELAQKLQQLGDDSVVSSLTSDYHVLGEGWGGYAKRNALGQTGLMLAIVRNDPEFVLKMIQRGADINAQDNTGLTPLFYAVESEDPVRYIKELLSRGADVALSDAKGRTALMLVPLIPNVTQRIESARLLLQAGLDANDRDKDGNTVWHYAAKALDHDLISFLKKESGTIQKNRAGKTARDVVPALNTVAKRDQEQLQKTLQALSPQ